MNIFESSFEEQWLLINITMKRIVQSNMRTRTTVLLIYLFFLKREFIKQKKE